MGARKPVPPRYTQAEHVIGTAKLVALLAIPLAPGLFAQGLLGTKVPGGKVRFQAVEELQIEGKDRVRLMPVSARQVTPDDAKKFAREELAQIGTLRVDARKRLVRLDSAGKPAEIILPDSFAPKTPVDAATAQPQLSILAIQSKKNKTSEPVPVDQFFVFVSGSDAERLALAFVNRTAAFASVDEQFTAMEGFVASFPESPAKAEFRTQLLDRLNAGLAAFESRGPFADLLATRRFGELAGRAFPNDAPLAEAAKRVVDQIQSVDTARLKLRSLAAGGEWDLLIDAYPAFETYQWSFPDLMALRQTALEESARLHAHRGTLLSERKFHADALREFSLATRRDPDNKEIAKLLETERVISSISTAAAAARRTMVPGTPQEIRFRRSLHDAERAIQDKDYGKAETSIQEAQGESKDAPEILLVRAKLLAARDRHAEALPLLDSYDRAVTDATEREAGNTARNDVLYDLDKKRAALRQQLRKLQQDGEYVKLRTLSDQALLLDPDDDEFLYFGGASAALLFDSAVAKDRLDRYLVKSNSLRGDLQTRDRAYRLRAVLNVPRPTRQAGNRNWLSGLPVPEGAYYCPASGAFQLPIDTVSGYKVKMTFGWEQDKLNTIATNFDDDKGLQNYRTLAGSGDAQGNFFFGYSAGDPQVQTAAHKASGPVDPAAWHVTHAAATPAHLVDASGQPRLVLRDSTAFNLPAMSLLEGPVATGIAGNAFFNPFIWDGIHYFALTYDARGQLATAQEWNADNLLRFVWSAGRLTEIRAFRKDNPTPYYQRTISYSGSMIVGESYSSGNKAGQIKYVYSGKVLQQVKVEDEGVHDGKTWTVRLR